jgi:hypothetical protein
MGLGIALARGKQAFSPVPRFYENGTFADVLTSLAWHKMRIIMVLLWHFDLHNRKENQDWPDQKVYITWEKRPLEVHLTSVRR